MRYHNYHMNFKIAKTYYFISFKVVKASSNKIGIYIRGSKLLKVLSSYYSGLRKQFLLGEGIDHYKIFPLIYLLLFS